MSYYQCQRCNFTTKQKTGMIRHLSRKNKCVKNIKAYKYTDEEIYNMSLRIIRDNNDYTLDILHNKCTLCNKVFSTKGNLKKHLKKHEDGSI